MISIFLAVPPPQTTAQQQTRVGVMRTRRGRYVGRIYKGKGLDRDSARWRVGLQPHRPRTPILGPVALSIRLVYPHRVQTRKRDRARVLPKTTKPDAGNSAKAIEDALVKLGFIEDDRQVVHLTVSKWWGPADQVGIGIEIRPMAAGGEE